MSIRFARWPQTARLFSALAHLDLGRDAASLYDPSRRAPWAAALLAAYRGAPGRLQLHGVGLVHPHDLLQRLREEPPVGLRDEAGRLVCRRMAEAMETLASEPAGFSEVPEASVEPLTVLRAGLWERQGDPPPLTIVDCPALARAGRAAGLHAGRVVAVSLAQPVGHLVCQVLHEEVHAVTDPVVSARWSADGVARTTEVGSAGFQRHRELEVAAVEVGEAIVQSRLPAWADEYARWRARFSM